MPSDLIFQAVCLQVLSFRPHAFRILDKIYLPKPRILDLFQQSKSPVCWVPCWLGVKSSAWWHQSQLLFCYCIAATGVIEYQGAVFVASNEPYSHHLHSDSKGLRFCVKLLTWLGLICIMTKLLAYNCKAIREDLETQQNQIKEGYFPTNGKMVGWRRKRFLIK